MNEAFMETEKMEQVTAAVSNGEKVQYEYRGYQIRVHFSGEKTLAECIRNLTERRIVG